MRATASVLLLSLLYTAPAAAQVSATASPVSNSSGSVVNQAVQITPGQYMKHSYGSQIQCDSATLNISPFASTTHSFGKPDNQYYQEPVYDNSDNFGLIDPETGLDGQMAFQITLAKSCITSRNAQVTDRTSAITSASQPPSPFPWIVDRLSYASRQRKSKWRSTSKP